MTAASRSRARASAVAAAVGSPRVLAALIAIYLIWGSTYLAIEFAIETLPPLLMGAVRLLVAGLILYAIAVARSGRHGRPTVRQWRAAAIIGIALPGVGFGGTAWAEQYLTSGITALLVAVEPVWVVLFAGMLLRERLPRRAVIGIIVGFLGLAILAGPVGVHDVDAVGALVMVGATISWAAGSLYGRRAPVPADPLLATGMQLASGGAFLTVIGVVSGELTLVRPGAFSAASLLAFAYLTVFGSVVAFTAYAWLLRNVPITLASTYTYVNPVVAVALGWLVLAEPLTARTLVGGAIIVGAVALVATAHDRRQDVEEAAPSRGSQPTSPPERAEALERRVPADEAPPAPGPGRGDHRARVDQLAREPARALD